MPPVVVFDTNILISALLSLRGNPFRCLALAVIAGDPDDDKVLECAVVGGAHYIVTGDRRHLLPLGTYQGIAIINAATLIALVAAP
jgi:predicted nucleic acid-binding protein